MNTQGRVRIFEAAMGIAASTPTLLPVIRATMSATRRQCAVVPPAWVVPSGKTVSSLCRHNVVHYGIKSQSLQKCDCSGRGEYGERQGI